RTAEIAQAPALIKVILCAGAVDLRMLCPIHIKQVVTLAKPPDRGLDNTQNRPHIMARSSDTEELIVPARHRRTLLPVVGVEVAEVLRQRRPLFPVNVVVEGSNRPIPLI